MAARIHSIQLKRHDKVRANIDLPEVPIGTRGKVLVVSGLTWLRYRVLFDNGVELGMLDGRHIVRAKDFVPLEERVEVDDTPVDGDSADDGGEGAAAAAGDDNEFGVPAHLLERSRLARERRAS